MNTASPLFNEFAKSAPIIGAERPRGKPEQGLYRLQEAMQEHYVHILKAVLERAYQMDTVSEDPMIKVQAGHPFQHDLFVDILPRDGMRDRLKPFIADLNDLRRHFAVDAGLDKERGLVLRFRAEDMKKAIDVMIHHYEIQGDERIARHMFALTHLIDRAGPPGGYVPSNKLT